MSIEKKATNLIRSDKDIRKELSQGKKTLNKIVAYYSLGRKLSTEQERIRVLLEWIYGELSVGVSPQMLREELEEKGVSERLTYSYLSMTLKLYGTVDSDKQGERKVLANILEEVISKNMELEDYDIVLSAIKMKASLLSLNQQDDVAPPPILPPAFIFSSDPEVLRNNQAFSPENNDDDDEED